MLQQPFALGCCVEVVAPHPTDAMDFNTGIAAVAGFEFAFMSGFCTSAARLGAPDTGLMSYYEMVEQVNPWQSTA